MSDDLPPISRREFAVTALAAGFALSVQPVAADTITTDTKGLTAGEVKIPVKDGTVPAYWAAPDKGGPFPTVLVVQEIFGVHEHIKDVCRRFAKAGFYAIAPDLYFRQGDVTKISDIQQLLKDIVAKVPDEQVMADFDSTVAFVKGEGKGDPAKLGITGFCWGGRITWLYAAHNPKVKAGVAWYGRLVGDKSALTPAHPVDIAANLKAPVLGLYGAKDTGIPLDSVDKMKTALVEGSSKSEFVVFQNSGHAFHADYRPSYVEADAKEGWSRCVDWFKKHGVA